MAYRNPVWPRSFPDPFVLRHRGEHWAYATGLWEDGRAFGILRSRDLVTWQPVGGALAPLPGDHPCYWAPEVAELDGRFFLYYSVGDEATMEIRVAEAASPAGPFVDAGRRLTREPFAIDAHVFTDREGTRWLFYATDFLTHSHVGTGTLRDRLLDPWTLEGRPRPVTLPRWDWQVYDPCRAEKGGVRWHTVEGSFVLARKGRYYQMFSGGNWQNPTYGVSYAVAESVEADGEWRQVADGERVLPILRTVPGLVVGPGHNSVVRPDLRQLWCVYHRWDLEAGARVMAIDPLDWVGERMLVLGPSTEERPGPERPTVADLFDREGGLGAAWEVVSGEWTSGGGEAVVKVGAGEGEARARCGVRATCFVAEVSLRVEGKEKAPGREDGWEGGGSGIVLEGREGDALTVLVAPDGGSVEVAWRGEPGPEERRIALPAGFASGGWHLARVEVDGARARLTLDGVERWAGRLGAPAERLALVARGTAVFSGFALTVGWEDLFEEDGDPAALGWEAAAGEWTVQGGELVGRGAPAVIAKGPLLDAYELVINARLLDPAAAGYGFYPALSATDSGPLLTLERVGRGWALALRDAGSPRSFSLPDSFHPATHQHFRCRKQPDGRLAVHLEAQLLGELSHGPGPTRVALAVPRGTAAFEMVRVTALAGAYPSATSNTIP